MSPAFAVWLTGLPSSGKSTIARALVEALSARGVEAAVLESDALRRILTPQPTYSEDERETFYQAMAYIGRQGLQAVALMSELEGKLGQLCPLAVSRLQAVADMTALSVAEVVADSGRRLR